MDPFILINIHLVLSLFIDKFYFTQNSEKPSNSRYSPTSEQPSNTASSAKAKKNIYKVFISRMYFYLLSIFWRAMYVYK